MRLIRLVTRHENRTVAADLWPEENVAAIGWSRAGDLKGKSKDAIKRALSQSGYDNRSSEYAASQLVTFRDKIRMGDLVLAYRCNNMVALVGEAGSAYRFEQENKVGDPSGPVRYPHQVKVSWWARPRDFHRTNLHNTNLPELVDWVALRGTIYYRDYADSVLTTLRQELNDIPNGAGPVSVPGR